VEIGLYKSGLGQGRMESWNDGFKGRKDLIYSFPFSHIIIPYGCHE
jgi:hypothetical protein